MKTRVTLLILLIILTLTAAQYGLAAEVGQESAGPALAGAIAVTVTVTPTATSSAGQDQTATTVASEPGQVFQVAIATYLMDTAGFHGIDERLNQEGVIEPGDAGVVTRISGVLAVTHWPAELQAQVDQLQVTLGQYAEALANDDVEAAQPLATEAHELQHDLSHAVEGWLGEMHGGGEHDAATEPGQEHAEDNEHEHSQ